MPFTVGQAKQFIISRIVAEAAHKNISLSEVEREMLHFSDGGAHLTPRMQQVNEVFERDYDESDYETKINDLARSLQQHLSREEQARWDEAVTALCDGDHYLLILINAAIPKSSILDSPWFPTSERPARRPRWDLIRLILTAIAVIIVGLLVISHIPESWLRRY
jgi:hypothetical protein